MLDDFPTEDENGYVDGEDRETEVTDSVGCRPVGQVDYPSYHSCFQVKIVLREPLTG